MERRRGELRRARAVTKPSNPETMLPSPPSPAWQTQFLEVSAVTGSPRRAGSTSSASTGTSWMQSDTWEPSWMPPALAGKPLVRCGLEYGITEDSSVSFVPLVAAREKALQSRFPEVTKQLLEYVQKDGQRFLEQVCAVGDGVSMPLSRSSPTSHPKSSSLRGSGAQARIGAPIFALTSRFEGGRLEKELAEERGWILSVLDLVDAEADKAERFRAVRIRRVIHPKLAALREVGPAH